MPRSGYLNLRITETNEPQIRIICTGLGIDPDSRGAYGQAINYAISYAAYGGVKMAQFKQCPHCLQSFNTDLVDIENHKRNCKRHIEETVDRKIKEFWAKREQ